MARGVAVELPVRSLPGVRPGGPAQILRPPPPLGADRSQGAGPPQAPLRTVFFQKIRKVAYFLRGIVSNQWERNTSSEALLLRIDSPPSSPPAVPGPF